MRADGPLQDAPPYESSAQRQARVRVERESLHTPTSRLASGARRDGAQPLRAAWDPTQGSGGRPRSSSRPPRAGVRSRSRLGRFVSSYGWRAYAVPVLVVITVLTVFDATQPDDPGAVVIADSQPGTSDPVAAATPDFGSRSTGSEGPDIIGVPPAADGSFNASIVSGALPDGGAFPESGARTWHVVPGTTPQVGTGTESVSTYTVEVEDGMDTSSFGGDESFARLVDQTLANPKSWTNDERFAVQRVDSGDPSFRITLTSQLTVRDECGYSIQLEVSCFNRSDGRVVINVARWVRGAIAFQGDVGSYRQYVINHEVGHAIGFRQHQPCESDGGLAPIMMQQTFGTSNDDIATLDPQGVVPANGFTCRFNPWPFPRA